MTHRKFIWRWQCELTRWNFPENSLGHEILKALSIERRSVNGHGVLEWKKVEFMNILGENYELRDSRGCCTAWNQNVISF